MGGEKKGEEKDRRGKERVNSQGKRMKENIPEKESITRKSKERPGALNLELQGLKI